MKSRTRNGGRGRGGCLRESVILGEFIMTPMIYDYAIEYQWLDKQNANNLWKVRQSCVCISSSVQFTPRIVGLPWIQLKSQTFERLSCIDLKLSRISKPCNTCLKHMRFVTEVFACWADISWDKTVSVLITIQVATTVNVHAYLATSCQASFSLPVAQIRMKLTLLLLF